MVAKLVILGISLFISFILTPREALVSKLVIPCLSLLTSFILALREALVSKLVISGSLSSILLTLALYASFIITTFFTISLIILKSTGTDTNLVISTYFSNCLN